MEGKARPEAAAGEGARFGFTITKKIGGAVERNRIRRRLRHALAGVIGEHADGRFDYVVVARRAALEIEFTKLSAELRTALERIHRRPKFPDPRRTAKGTGA